MRDSGIHFAPGSTLFTDSPENALLDELRGLWLSRLMFNPFVGWPPETRTFEEYVAATAPELLA